MKGETYEVSMRLYKNPDGSIEKSQKTVVLATGEDQKFDFVLMVRAKKRG